MESERFNVWLQLVGMAGIVASLIFVGLQLKQSQDIAVGAQYTERAAAAADYWYFAAEQPLVLARNGAQHREHLKALDYYEDDWTDEEVGLRYAQGRAFLVSWDNNLYQYESGFMTEEGWLQYANSIRLNCGTNGLGAVILKNHRELFRPSLIEQCLQFVDER